MGPELNGQHPYRKREIETEKQKNIQGGRPGDNTGAHTDRSDAATTPEVPRVARSHQMLKKARDCPSLEPAEGT